VKLDNIPEITMRMYEEYKRSWEHARETMTSSALTLHFGHYVARIANNIVGKLNAILANEWLASSMAPQR